MAISQFRSQRKISGGRYRPYKKKKLRELGNLPTFTMIGKEKRKIKKTRGANIKQRLFQTDIANLLDPKTKKYDQVKIITVVDNPANRHFIRRNIITKGTIIKTEKGNAKVTSRPGQDGIVNAILLETK